MLVTLRKLTLALSLVVIVLVSGRRHDLGAVEPAQQTPQKPSTSAEPERRDQPVTNDDLRILLKADELLKDESVWNRSDDRECDDDEAAGKRPPPGLLTSRGFLGSQQPQ